MLVMRQHLPDLMRLSGETINQIKPDEVYDMFNYFDLTLL